MNFSEFHRAILARGAVTVRPGLHLMHHSNAAKVWTWDEKRQQSYTLEHADRSIALRLADEQHQDGDRRRVILFGRQLQGRQTHAGNTARATFNSTNSTPDGYFLRPTLAPEQKAALRVLLGNQRSWPKYIHGHVMLAKGDAATVLASFLKALAIIEEVKSQPKALLAKKYPALPTFSSEDMSALGAFDEGKKQQLSREVRARSAKLRNLAVAYYRHQSTDGRLRCFVDGWTPEIPVSSNIIEMHHDDALAGYPEAGKSVTFEEAIKFLFPLCPNCHRLLHAKPGGGRYTIPELRALMQRRGKAN